MSSIAIERHALLSDCHSAALVTDDGSVDWLTVPRFDAPSVFARLLDDDAGHFSIRPTGDAEVERRYLPDSLVLQTTFSTPSGVLELTDALCLGEDDHGHQLGVGAPHTLLRRAAVLEGSVEIEVVYRPRPEYGRAIPVLERRNDTVFTRGSPDALALSTEFDLELAGGAAQGQHTRHAGEQVVFALQWARAWEGRPRAWSTLEIIDRLERTIEAWQTWSADHQTYEGPWRDLVRFSGIVLHGLTFQPTGAIIAAPTTSLPETVGGSRNWDYRYTWLRDASLTLEALWIAACPEEAVAFVDWLVGAAAGDVRSGSQPQIMYGIAGEHDLAERTLDHLDGWRDSPPVRVGNGAYDQAQLDVYGEVLGAVARFREQLTRSLDDTARWFLRELAGIAADRWREEDQGIWEIRSAPRHYLNSKLMCWVALDRAIDLADLLHPPDDELMRWHHERQAVRTMILDEGFDDDIGAFTQSFGSPVLDASALRLPIVGLLPGDDPRVRSTIEVLARDLVDDNGFVYRYQGEDGLDGDEGTFLLCTFWLAHAQALSGDAVAARRSYERAIGVRNDLELLAEEFGDGAMLGNFPQAFSHVGLVTAAAAIAACEAP